MLYLLSVEYAQNANLTEKLATRLTASQRDRRRRRFEAGALIMLRESSAAGFNDAARLAPRIRF